MKYRNIPIFIPHSACLHRCVFCDQTLITGQRHVPAPDAVKLIISNYLKTLDSAAEIQVAFFGGNFTALPFSRQMAYLEAVQPFIQTGQVQGIRFSTRPDCIQVQNLAEYKAWSVKVIELGIQSFSDPVLAATKRGYSALDAIQSAKLIKAGGIALGLQLMPGLPEDSFSRSLESASVAVSLRPDMVRIYPTLVLAGTKLADWLRTGKYQPLTLEQAIELSKAMQLLFDRSHIPIIRMGLQASEELSDASQVLAGPYHPAFGELVAQRIFLAQTLHLLKSCSRLPEALTFFLHPRDVSQFTGHRRANLTALEKSIARSFSFTTSYYLPERNWVGIGSSNQAIPEYILTREEFSRLASSDTGFGHEG